MMSMTNQRYQGNCSSADAVFGRDGSRFQDTCCSHYNNVHSPNSSVDAFGTAYSPRDLPVNYRHEPNHSPTLSTCSTHSQEVKYIFDPKFGAQRPRSNLRHFDQVDPSGNSTEDACSQIQFSHRNVLRKCSSSSHYIYKSQTQNQSQVESQIVSKSNPPTPPTRTSNSASSQLSLQDDIMQASKNSVFQSVSSSCTSYGYPYHQSRRKTLSPEQLHIGGRDHRKYSFSNELVLTMRKTYNMDNIYQDLNTGPPTLAPISGVLTQPPDNGIVKPIAFKPIITAHQFITPPKQNLEQTQKYSSHDDGYVSQDYGMTNQNAVNTLHGSQDYGMTNQNAANTPDGSYHMMFDRSASEFNMTSDMSDSAAVSYLSRFSSNHNDGYVQTPSPIDSGIGELEVILKEKDAELITLRDVMDKNERAIFQVYEEKRSAWVKDIQDIRDEYETKIRYIQSKTYKSEHMLNLQIFKLQQDKKAMQEEIDKLNAEKDDMVQKCDSFAEETNRLQALIDDATWQAQGCRQLGEVSNLQSEIDKLNWKLRFKAEEVLRLTAKLDETKSKSHKAKSNNVNGMKRCTSELFRPKSSSECFQQSNHSRLSNNEPDHHLCHFEKEVQTDFTKNRSPEMEILQPSLLCEREINALYEQLDKYRHEIQVNKNTYDKEKEQWLAEKNKVIMYQKQLQLNYVQMFRKNNILEAEVEQLTIELESRDLKLLSLTGEESMC